MRPSRPLAAALACALLAPAAALAEAPAPAKSVEVERYTGRWHEIARMPNRTQAGCEAPTADYAVAGDKLSLVQTCRKGSPSGPEKVYRASGRILDPGRNAKLRLTFLSVITREFWILDRALDYSWAVVGDPKGKLLWLMSRKPKPTPAERETMVAAAEALGYDIARLEFPVQEAEPSADASETPEPRRRG